MIGKFKLTDDEISQINNLVNEMESEPKYVCEAGSSIREIELRGQPMEVYVSVRVIEDEDGME